MATFAYTPTQVPFDVEAAKQFYEEPVRTAVWGGAWATNAFLPLIEKGDVKKIAHITSSMANTDTILVGGVDYGLAYSIAKAGMNVQIAKYAVELAPKGIKTVAICPGWVDTWDGKNFSFFPLFFLASKVVFANSIVDKTGPKPPQLVEAIKVMLTQFQKIDPDIKGQISVEQSVAEQLRVIEALDAARSGTTIRSKDY